MGVGPVGVKAAGQSVAYHPATPEPSACTLTPPLALARGHLAKLGVHVGQLAAHFGELCARQEAALADGAARCTPNRETRGRSAK
jgi:hypothetical protein